MDSQYGFSLNEIYPPVINLQLHLENAQMISFKDTTNLTDVIDIEQYPETTLTQFLWMNKHDPLGKSKNLLYQEFPEDFIWTTLKTWKKRKQGKVIGRIITAGPTEGERYF